MDRAACIQIFLASYVSVLKIMFLCLTCPQLDVSPSNFIPVIDIVPRDGDPFPRIRLKCFQIYFKLNFIICFIIFYNWGWGASCTLRFCVAIIRFMCLHKCQLQIALNSRRNDTALNFTSGGFGVDVEVLLFALQALSHNATILTPFFFICDTGSEKNRSAI